MTTANLFSPEEWHRAGGGARYLQLHRHISEAISDGTLSAGDQLPAERELATLADISRVTVRKAISQLVADGLIEQRQGAGSFVRGAAPKLKQSLSTLVSFTENLNARGLTSNSTVLSCGLYPPNSAEMFALGVSSSDRVARVYRLRSAGDTPIAIENSTLPIDILPDPTKVKTSLYQVLRKTDSAPTRAIQRVTAQNANANDAEMLLLREGAAVLKIDRTGYVRSGRPIEYSSGIYRSDLYDFVSELREEEL
ncbi:MAG: GntR family transcriptional regulator [Marinosulfonomonas sp.]